MRMPARKASPMPKMKRMNDRDAASACRMAEALEALEKSRHWILLSHEQPDGDTLGCASALFSRAKRIGKAVRWAGPDQMPSAYGFLPWAECYEPAATLPPTEGSVLVFLDATSPERTLSALNLAGTLSINVDHHGDNSLFAQVNLVDTNAGATAELVWELLQGMHTPLSRDEAVALYTGLVTDTGRFGYSCTTPRSHRVAADLLEAGVSPETMDRLLYCNWTPQALRLRGRAFSRMEYDRDRGFAMSWLTRSDFEETGADYSETEGLSSDLLRIADSRFSALLVENGSSVRVSLRSRGNLSAADVAHRHGGGGHPKAAGMRLPLPIEAAVETLREEIRDLDG